MQRLSTILLIILFTLLSDIGLITARGDEEQGQTYTITRGDTLWAISEQSLGNPFLWPKLWQWNDYITNPHLIYPGNNVNLHPPKVMVKHPEKEVAPEEPEKVVEVVEEVAPAPEIVEETFSTTELWSTGLISKEKIDDAGKILDAEDEKVMLSSGDIVYVVHKDNMEPGNLYTVFKKEREIIHPATRKSLGYKIAILGTIEIEEDNNGLTTAKIMRSFDVISRGDLIMPNVQISDKVTIRPAAAEMKGYVVAGKEDRVTFGEGDVVYIDLGEEAGVEAGNSFIAYKVGETVRDKKTKKDYTLPSTTIGRLLVLAVSDRTSAALIVNSVEEIRVGEHIRTEVGR